MSNHQTKAQGGGAGRTILWVALALALGLLAYLTLGLAIPNNPLYSDRAAHGISKYKFLEECQEGIARAEQLSEVQGQMVQAGMLGADDSLKTEVNLPSKELVRSIRTVPQGSWQLQTPVLLNSRVTDQQVLEVMAQCSYDKAANKTTVALMPMGMPGM